MPVVRYEYDGFEARSNWLDSEFVCHNSGELSDHYL